MKKDSVLKLIAPALFLVVIIMWFVVDVLLIEGQIFDINFSSSFSLKELSFGYKESTIFGEVAVLNFSFLNFLSLIFILGAFLGSLYLALAGKKAKTKTAKLVVLLLSIAAITFILFCRNFTIRGNGESAAETLKDYDFTVSLYLMLALLGGGGIFPLFSE